MPIHKKIFDYLRSSKAELEKVSWPTRKDTSRYASLVIGVSLVVAIFFAMLDLGLGKTVEAVLTGRTAAQAPPVQPTTSPSQPIEITPDDIQATSPTGKPVDIKVTPVK